jgi:hypothetical protein
VPAVDAAYGPSSAMLPESGGSPWGIATIALVLAGLTLIAGGLVTRLVPAKATRRR